MAEGNVTAATRTPHRRNLEVLHQLREIETHMKDTGDIFEKEKKDLDSQELAAIETIEKQIKQIEDLGQKSITTLQDKFKKEHERLGRENKELTQSQTLVENSIKALETASKVGSEEEIFLATKRAEIVIPKFQEILKDSNKVPHIVIDFAIDSRLVDITSVGDEKRSSFAMDHSPKIIDLLNTKQRREYYQWLDVLPFEQLILLSYSPESHLRLYSASGRHLSKLLLPAAVSATTLNGNQIIVALCEVGQLQIVNVCNDLLNKGTVIDLDVLPILILEYSSSSVFIFAKKRDGHGYFQVLDNAGKPQKSTRVDTDLQAPLFMRMNPEKNAVYIIDGDKGCVGFNMEGEMLLHFTYAYHDQYWGLAVDRSGALYFSTFTYANFPATSLIKLSPAGHVLGQRSLRFEFPLKCSDDKLYLIALNDRGEKEVRYIFI